jgi:hypothetical protein
MQYTRYRESTYVLVNRSKTLREKCRTRRVNSGFGRADPDDFGEARVTGYSNGRVLIILGLSFAPTLRNLLTLSPQHHILIETE